MRGAWCAVVLLFLVGTEARAQVLDRAPYLQMGTPTTMTVAWRTATAATGRVRWGSAPGQLTNELVDATSRRQHELRITGLQPATRYYYDVGTTTAVLAGGDAEHYFDTSPPAGSTPRVRAWILGDSGTGGSGQLAARDAMLAFTGRYRPRFMLHMGDMAYNSGTDSEFTNNFFDVYADILRHTVTWATLGNHEGASSDSATQSGPYYEAYVLPAAGEAGGVVSGTEAYYSFDDANVHYVVLDSHESPRTTGGAMLTWLQQDLAATSADWIVAFWHHPPYSKGTHDSDTESQLVQMRTNALPILEGAGVDLVLAGHSHIYERSFLIDSVYAVSTQTSGTIVDNRSGDVLGTGPYVKPVGNGAHQGAVYIVAGHGGASLGRISVHPVMFASEPRYGSCILDIQGNRLSVVNVRDDGVLSDSFSLVKGTGLVLGAPNGGEQFAPGAATTIRWATVGTIPRVVLSYSLDDGRTWTTIATVDNTGSHPWTLPLGGSSTMLVRVASSTDATVFDESNAGFGITSDVIPFGDTWRYNDTGTDLGNAWLSEGYIDSTWASGPAELGYGDSDESTILANRSPNDPSVYFRKTINLAAPVDSALLEVVYDDGIVVYVNGQQVLARNMANGTAYSVFASAQSADNARASTTLGAGNPFRVGANTVAVMVKQSDGASSDVSFDLHLRVTFGSPSAGDGGPPADAGSTIVPDAGTVMTGDAGTVTSNDAGATMADAGNPTTNDGGTTTSSDAGTTSADAGTTTTNDAGMPRDGGAPRADAGVRGDGGSVVGADAGAAAAVDAGTGGGDTPEPACACRSTGTDAVPGLMVMAMTLAMLRASRRRVR